MAMDGLMLGAIIYELNNILIGGKVDKINQPEADELHIIIRANGKNHKLLLCSNANFARIHLTETNKPNPDVPSVFCMLLRKHLTGAKISSFEQVANDRIVHVIFDCYNDFNEQVKKHLILEIMGKHSNIIFTDDSFRIFDSIKRVNSVMSRVRLVQPGLPYIAPPSQDKCDPFTVSAYRTDSARIISDTYSGISKQSAEEIYYRCSVLNDSFESYINIFRSKKFEPVILTDEAGSPVDFFPTPQLRFADSFQQRYSTLSEAVDSFYFEKDKVQRIKERSHGLKIKLNNLLEKALKKKAQQEEKFLECADMEKYRIYGELLTANIFLIKKGARSVTVQNYYDNFQPLEIPLDNTISPSANAQKYFKQYNKLKTASKMISDLMSEAEKEIDIFSSLLESLEKCETESDLNDIKQELTDLGYIKPSKEKHKKVASKPMHFVSSSGIDIFVGKNNLQNDELTMRFADSDDLWLHVKDTHGSHVIVRSDMPDNKTIEEAALLAAYYSKAKLSSVVPVDATKRRFVKKPSGSLPGKVIYSNHQTYFITPSEEAMLAIKKL